MQREFHPVANIFPLMVESEIADLAADIKAHGLREPIWLDQDSKIIDGRNRYVACQRAKVEPTFRVWTGEGSLIEFVISLNLKRRHLNESARSMVAAEIANLKNGQRADLVRKSTAVEISTAAVTTQEAADLLNISRDAVQRAKVVLKQGTPEEIDAVKRGDAAVTKVAQLIRQGVEPEQRKAEVLRPKTWTDARGRRMPEKPTPECIERGIDQLNNTLDALAALFDRPDATTFPEFTDWVANLEKSRTALSRLINRNRERSAA